MNAIVQRGLLATGTSPRQLLALAGYAVAGLSQATALIGGDAGPHTAVPTAMGVLFLSAWYALRVQNRTIPSDRSRDSLFPPH